MANCSRAKLGRAAPVEELYRGVFSAVRNVARVLRSSGLLVDVYAISARHGLLRGDVIVEPYDEYLSNPSPEWVDSVGAGILDVVKSADLAVISLSGPYARSLARYVEEACGMGNVLAVLPRSSARCGSSIGVVGPGHRMRVIRLVGEAILAGLRDVGDIISYVLSRSSHSVA